MKLEKLENSLPRLFPDLMKEWDYDKNTWSPFEVTHGSSYKAWWLCSKKRHSWRTSVHNRTGDRHHGCPQCFRDCRVPNATNNLAAVYPQFTIEWSDKNGSLRPEDVFAGSKKKVWWKCGEGHEYQATVKDRVKRRKIGCPICACLSFRFPQIAAEWDYEKNGGTPGPDATLPMSKRCVWWKCKDGHGWQDTITHRIAMLGGKGLRSMCPECRVIVRPHPPSYYGRYGRNHVRVSRDHTVTHFVRDAIGKGTLDYNDLLRMILDGIKSGHLIKPASCLIIHSIIKAELMNLCYKAQGFADWREVCRILKIKTGKLTAIQAELGEHTPRHRLRSKPSSTTPGSSSQGCTCTP